MPVYFPPSLKFTPKRLVFSTWMDHLPFGYDIVVAQESPGPFSVTALDGATIPPEVARGRVRWSGAGGPPSVHEGRVRPSMGVNASTL